MTVPAADNLRHYELCDLHTGAYCSACNAARTAADLLDDLSNKVAAIAALPDTIDTYPFDGYDDFAHGKAFGWEEAMREVKALLHPAPEEDK